MGGGTYHAGVTKQDTGQRDNINTLKGGESNFVHAMENCDGERQKLWLLNQMIQI